MATQTVPFAFICRAETDFDMLEFNHAIPKSLITATPGAGHQELLDRTFGLICKEHEPQCRSKCSKQCVVCGVVTDKVKMITASHLRQVDDPQVTIFASTVCEKSACQMKAQQDYMEFVEKAAQAEVATTGNDVENKVYGPCRICGKVEKTQRCSKCKLAAYCGSEHQKQDWPQHKKNCKVLSKSKPASNS